jgi:peptide/nickel transport system permease protein
MATSSLTVPRGSAWSWRALWSKFAWLFRNGRAGVSVGCAVLATLLLAAFFLPFRYGPNEIQISATLRGPSGAHWFGTDQVGRDVFARVVTAGGTDLPLALGGTGLALLIGVTIGLMVSVKSKWSERGMRGLDMFQAFPVLILAIAIVSLGGNNITWVMLAIALIFFPTFTRLVRSESLALRESRFIEAAMSIGASRYRITTRHILPNVVGIILVQVAIAASHAVLLIAGLSFLGIGVHPPTPSWGEMIQQGSEQIVSGQWWIAVFPGIFVVVCVFMFNMIGDGLDAIMGRGARS